MPPAEPGYSDEGEIATTTLAEIYVQQGLFERALAIYRRIALRSPQDGRVAERIEDLTRRLRGTEEGAEGAGAPEPELEIPIPVDEIGAGEPPASWDAAAEGAGAGDSAIPVPEEEPARASAETDEGPAAPAVVRSAAPTRGARPGPLSDAEFAAWLARR